MKSASWESVVACTYQIDPQAMFEDRDRQFVSFGIHEPDVAAVRAVVTDILGNAFGLDRAPTTAEHVDGIGHLSRHGPLAGTTNAPMLIINGADDYNVPQADALVFCGRPNTEVHLIEGTGHCAVSEFPEVIPTIADWIQTALVPQAVA